MVEPLQSLQRMRQTKVVWSSFAMDWVTRQKALQMLQRYVLSVDHDESDEWYHHDIHRQRPLLTG